MIGLHELAQRLGGELGRNGIVTCPGPGHSPKDRSLSVWLDGGDLRVYSFPGDDWQVCKDHVRERLGLSAWEPGSPRTRTWSSSRTSKLKGDSDQTARTDLARQLWHGATDPRVPAVMNYLEHRGLPPLSDDQLPVFRFHPRCPFDGERVPVLLARFSPIEDDPGLEVEPSAIFRIRLDTYVGGKRKLCLGPSGGQVIKLYPDISLAGLGIVEGVEKGLALIASGWAPIWVTSGTSTMSSFPLLPWMEALTVFADRDGPGRDAALAAVARWHDAGREARILQPPPGCKDWDQWYVGGGQL